MATPQGYYVKFEQKNINDLPLDVAGYYFDVITEHSLNLNSQITDNWLENNTVINDHIANQPLTITLRGLKGELYYIPNEKDRDELLKNARQKTSATVFNKLSKLTSLYPPVDNLTQIAINVKDYVTASAKRYIGVVKQFVYNNNYAAFSPRAQQQYESEIRAIYERFNQMRELKAPFEVETPYATFKNMYIQSLALRQGNQLYVSDVEVTFKQVKFTDTLTTKADEKVLAQYNDWQRAEVENHGNVQSNSVMYDYTTPGASYINGRR
jgi:hypothetical protein